MVSPAPDDHTEYGPRTHFRSHGVPSGVCHSCWFGAGSECAVRAAPVVTEREGPRSMGCNRSLLRRYVMDARINYFGNALAGKVMKHLNSAGAAVQAALPVTTQELVKI